MNTSDLYAYMRKDEYIKLYSPEVLPKDHLPVYVVDKPKIFIVNTDNSSQSGEHWISIFVDSTPEFFDPLGNKPLEEFHNFLIIHGPNYLRNTHRLQAFGSKLCGMYCLLYCYFRCRGYTMENILKIFKDNLNFNELLVFYFYEMTQ